MATILEDPNEEDDSKEPGRFSPEGIHGKDTIQKINGVSGLFSGESGDKIGSMQNDSASAFLDM